MNVRTSTNFESLWRPVFGLAAAVLLCAGCRASQPRQIDIVRLPAQHSVQSDQLLLLSDFKLDKEHPLFHDLVILRQQVAATLDLPLSGRQVIVYLFSNELEYRQYLEATFPGLPPRRAYFVGSSKELAVYTFWGDRIQEDLRHEFTHGLLHASLKDVPLWLDEGLAEYFEVVGPEPGEINAEYANVLATSLGNDWRPNMERLERLRTVGQMQRIDYQESWAWVHYLLHSTTDNRLLLLTYLDDLKTNPDPGSLNQRLVEAQPNLDARFLSYVASLNTPGISSQHTETIR